MQVRDEAVEILQVFTARSCIQPWPTWYRTPSQQMAGCCPTPGAGAQGQEEVRTKGQVPVTFIFQGLNAGYRLCVEGSE